MYIPFNEMSLHTDFISQLDEYRQSAVIVNFEALVVALKKQNLLDYFFGKENLTEEISILLNNKYITGTRKSLLYSIFTKDIIQINPDNCLDEFVFNLNEKVYKSLGCAYASRDDFDKLVISVPSNEIWQRDSISGTYNYYDETADSEKNKTVSLKQIFDVSQISLISSMDLSKKKNNISSGQDLWEQRETLYPNLIFLDEVKKQFYGNISKYDVDRIMSNLDSLQRYLEKLESDFNIKDLSGLGVNISPESSSVDNNEKWKQERTFVLPNGKSEYFSLHIKFNTIFAGATRMYILPIENSNKCYVGSVSKHKHTKKN